MQIITKTKDLENYCNSLKDNEFITVDTEFSRDKTYYPKLCLIQVADEKTAVIIDPLAKDIDLTPFLKVLKNSKILKVFHASRQDIEIFFRLMDNDLPYPIFDTQIAASACGFGEFASYEKLVKDLANIDIDKTHRVTDWSKRPLSKQQIDYAFSDVIHLRTIYKKLSQELYEKNNYDLIIEEMEKINNPDNYVINIETVYKKIKIKTNSVSYISIMQKLAKWREQTCQFMDIPRNFLIKDQTLLEIAAIKPKSLEELYSIRGTEDIDELSANEIITIINSPIQLITETNFTNKNSYPKNTPEIMLLKLLLYYKSQEHGIAESVIAKVNDIVEFFYEKDSEKIEKLKIMQGWRYHIFGQFAKAMKEGRILFQINKDKKLELIIL